MSGPVAIARPLPRFLTVSRPRELGILLTLSVLFPFLMHLLPVPETSRLGARLLPMFYAPLLAALWGRRETGWLVALLAPWLNWALTGHPAPLGAIVIMIQLLVFVLVVPLLLNATFVRWLVAIPAYFAGMALSLLAALLIPALIGGRPPLTWAVQSVIFSLPGVAALVVITCLVLRYYPPAGKGGGPVAA
ncbi:MAG: hypothetical protein PSU94_08860 [Lacunisphaera sp.]|nr:hypothetical protein [Lacunisphaera sp.]